jgi:membrane protein
MSSIVVLLGAQLNSEIEHQIIKDPTIGREKPLGEALPRPICSDGVKL